MITCVEDERLQFQVSLRWLSKLMSESRIAKWACQAA